MRLGNQNQALQALRVLKGSESRRHGEPLLDGFVHCGHARKLSPLCESAGRGFDPLLKDVRDLFP